MQADLKKQRDGIKLSLAIVVHGMVDAVLADAENRAQHEADFIENLAHVWFEALLDLRASLAAAASASATQAPRLEH